MRKVDTVTQRKPMTVAVTATGDTNPTNQFNEHKIALQDKENELCKSILSFRELIFVHSNPDATDEAQDSADRDIAVRNLDRASKTLQNVRSAQDRLEDGTFGECLRCDEKINPKRMAAVPWTKYCIDCQDYFDKNPEEEQVINLAAEESPVYA